MIKINLTEEKRKKCEELFLRNMVARLPFKASEIYGKSRKEDKYINLEKKSKIEETRKIIWKNYKGLYHFLYMTGTERKEPINDEEAAKVDVSGEQLRRLLVGRENEMQLGQRRIKLQDIIREIGKINDENSFLLKNIFKYNSYADTVGAKEILKILNIEVCPYCNRSFTTTIRKKRISGEWKGARPQFDHYYPKKMYPYLAVNFYNLIPSCSSCNQYKLDYDTYISPMLYPFDEGLGKKYAFKSYVYDKNSKWKFHNTDELSKDFKLTIEPVPQEIYIDKTYTLWERAEFEKRIECSKNKLHLEELYNTHKNYAAQILRNGYFYNEAYVKMLNQCFLEIHLSEQEVKEILYCKDIREENWNQNILAKLVYDMDKSVRN